MIVSVTVLGAVGKSQESIAEDIVQYVEKGRVQTRAGRRPGAVIDLPSPDGGTVAYYADSAGLRPGRWLLGHKGVIDPQTLKAILAGFDPMTGERLLSGSGHADRSEHLRTAGISPTTQSEWFTSREVAVQLGVSDSYVQRRCRQAIQSGDEAACQGIERTADGRAWQIHRDALARFLAERRPKRIVVGYDVTYSAPKSVSVLWAGADDATKAEVLAAFDEAVAAGTRYFERHALVVRERGEQHRAEGVFAADYLHATNRALEPQLHHHVIVANYGKGNDGDGRALDARMLFLHAKTAGFLAASELRHQLTARLGVRWGEIVNGIAEIEGVPETARKEMSTRSKEIAASLDELGYHSARARQLAAWDTRAAKEHGVDIEALMMVWDERLRGADYGPEARSAVLGQVDTPGVVNASELERLFSDLARVAGITANTAVFDRRLVVQTISEFAGARLSGDAIDELADRFLAQPAVVRLQPGHARLRGNIIRREDGQAVVVPQDALYSTRPMLDLEARAVTAYARGRDAGVGIVPDAVLAAVLDDAHYGHLSEEQRRFVRAITTSGMRIQAAVGAAGSGKTTALEPAVEAWTRAGYTVVGAAVGGTQTVVLGEEARVDARTVASVIARYFNFGNIESINDRTVLLVDEASLLSTQDFVLLAKAVAERGATMRIVGDPAQHSSVAAGGIFRYLVERHPEEVPALTTIYRQQGPAMAEVRLANAEYREGQIAEALERLQRDGRIIEAESAEQAFDLLACAWYDERKRRLTEPGRKPSSMTAEHHFERIELNARARALLKADGTLSGKEVTVAGLSFQRGDEVIARVGDRDLRSKGAPRRSWVRNGTFGVVQSVHDDHLVVVFERWGRVNVPTEYVAREISPGIRGGLQHAYALTTHAAEGSTFAVATPLLTDASSRPGVYVGITRGQFDLRAVIIRRRALVPPPTDDRLPALVDKTDALQATARRLDSEMPELLASELDPLAARAHELARHSTLFELAGMAVHRDDRPLHRRAMHERARIVGTQAVVDPGADVLAHFGPRPAGGSARSTWDQAVAMIAVWREREQAAPVPGVSPVSWALGIRPTSRAARHDYQAIANLIAIAERGRADPSVLVPDNDATPFEPMLTDAMLIASVGDPAAWRVLSDEELRRVADALGREIAWHKVRIASLDDVAAGEGQNPVISAGIADGGLPEDRSQRRAELLSVLDRYRGLADTARAEVTGRGLTDSTPDFLSAGANAPLPEPPPVIDVPEGPVLMP